MTMYTVLITEPIADAGVSLLRTAGVTIRGPLDAQADLPQAIRDVDAVIVRSAVLSAAILGQANQLRIIAKHGVGTDNIDRAACDARQIAIAVTAGANSDSVAEFVLGAFVALARNLVHARELAVQGQFRRKGEVIGTEWHGKSIGVIGYGNIGRAVVPRLAFGLGVKVVVYDPFVRVEEPSMTGQMFQAEKLDDLLGRVEGVTLHVPLTSKTRHLINATNLSRLKPGSYLVNTSRGAVVEQEALREAIRTGALGGAALDVFDPEPPVSDDPLLYSPRVLATPHIASNTREAMDNMAVASARAVLQELQFGL